MPPHDRRHQSLKALATAAAACVQREAAQGQSFAVAETRAAGQVAQVFTADMPPRALDWIERQLQHAQASDFVLEPPAALELAFAAREAFDYQQQQQPHADPLAEFYESLLAALDHKRRTHRGVFYTPVEMVRFLVRSVDRTLRDEWKFPRGVLDNISWRTALAEGLVADCPPEAPLESPVVRILDPALGAGVFLTEIIRHARCSFTSDAAWNEALPEQLLARLGGIEIAPAAVGIAIVRIAETLLETGYRFESPQLLDIRSGDALAQLIRPPWTVIVGNPPFSGIGRTRHAWVSQLMRGNGPDAARRASYFDVGGQPLGERKHWLLDDYVQFLRIAHEQVETCGVGIIALVTPHGYLDNLSFRGLRDQLARTFPNSQIVDLHGNSKRRERSPDGSRDENVFGIEQGIALTVHSRAPCAATTPRLQLVDLWGPRDVKLKRLAECDFRDLAPRAVTLTSPGQAWVSAAVAPSPEYDSGWSLADAMPIHTTAPVTARDAFVVAFDAADFEQRLCDLRDTSRTDDELRHQYFHNSRSRRYLPGDTRGWKLSAARRRVQQLADQGERWQSLVARVQYRPFDERAILWADWLIDWPRSEVMRHVCLPDNLTLITRRQAPSGQPWNYAWITSELALDGVIRSDNCGSESLFPLWLSDVESPGAQPNFAPEFIAELERAAARSVAPHEVLAYIYALLQATTYRSRYAARLCQEFPRIVMPRNPAQLDQLAALGARLIDVHLLRTAERSVAAWSSQDDRQVAAGYPKWNAGKLFINPQNWLGCSQVAWKYCVGSHQVLRKFLRARLNRALSERELERVAQIVGAIDETARVVARIDAALAL
jgi:predicted helicase